LGWNAIVSVCTLYRAAIRFLVDGTTGGLFRWIVSMRSRRGRVNTARAWVHAFTRRVAEGTNKGTVFTEPVVRSDHDVRTAG
jgi:hypothetical protein